MTSLRLITAPTFEPVSVETAKSFLRVDGTEEDALIQSLIRSARETGEELARRAFVTQTLEMVVDDWPPKFALALWRPPLQSVVSVKYYDEDGAEATWTDYVVNARSEPGRIIFNSTPGITLLESGGVVVRYIAGYTSEATVPDRIKNAILQLVAQWFENRSAVNVGNSVIEMPMSSKQAFIAERVNWFPS